MTPRPLFSSHSEAAEGGVPLRLCHLTCSSPPGSPGHPPSLLSSNSTLRHLLCLYLVPAPEQSTPPCPWLISSCLTHQQTLTLWSTAPWQEAAWRGLSRSCLAMTHPRRSTPAISVGSSLVVQKGNRPQGPAPCWNPWPTETLLSGTWWAESPWLASQGTRAHHTWGQESVCLTGRASPGQGLPRPIADQQEQDPQEPTQKEPTRPTSEN